MLRSRLFRMRPSVERLIVVGAGVPSSVRAVQQRMLAAVGIGIAVLALMLVMLARAASPYPERIDLLMELLGQPRAVLQAAGVSCPEPVSAAETSYCYAYPGEGRIAQVVFAISGGTVRQIRLILHGDALAVGDLAAVLRRPAVEHRQGITRLSWSDHDISATSLYMPFPFSYHAIIDSVTIGDAPAGRRRTPIVE